MGPLSLLYKSLLWPLLTYASPGWFPFLSVTNITKLECLHRAASRAITGCLSSSPIPLLLSEASLSPLRVTLTHFTLLSYERALRLPTSFPISGLARLGVKPRLCRSSWRAFASTHPLMLPSTSPREASLALPVLTFLKPAFLHRGVVSLAEACAILHVLCWFRRHQQVCHFSSFLLPSDSRSSLPPHSFLYFSFNLNISGRCGRICLLSPSVLSGYNGFPDTRFSRRTTLLMS